MRRIEVSFEEAIEVAETIRRSIDAYYIDGHVTISGGVAHSSRWKKEELFKPIISFIRQKN